MATLKKPDRTHKHRPRWLEDSARQRASYLCTTRLLAPFLVLHRFEGNQAPQSVKRARYGYGIRLNASYLSEILGHIRSAEATYDFGPLAEGEPDEDGTPKGGIARDLHADATMTGVPLREFMEGEVLEWMLSSPGGFLVVDAPPRAEGVVSQADEKATGARPFFKFIPWDAVEDLDPIGLRWIKYSETVDNRSPDGEDVGETTLHVLYELTPEGTTRVGRYDKDGNSVNAKGEPEEPRDLGKFTPPPVGTTPGAPRLPVIAVRFGTHPELNFLGTGLLMGLDDIIIDLYNVTSEMREAFRDASFALWTHKGPDGVGVKRQMEDGTRLALLGEDTAADLQRIGGDGGEVTTGITLIELGVKNWALSAKRQAAEAMQGAGAQPTSGVSLQAEFQLDLKPLLVRISTKLDAIETEALFLAAQMAGKTVESADELKVTRAHEYRLEDEASRIARIVKDYALSLPLTATMKEKLAMRWLEMAKVIDLSEEVEVPEEPEAPAVPGAESDPAAAGTDPKAPSPAAHTGRAKVKPPKGAKMPPTAEERAAGVAGGIVPKAGEGEEPATVTMTVGERIEQELREAAEAEAASKVAMAFGPGLDPDAPFPALPVRGDEEGKK